MKRTIDNKIFFEQVEQQTAEGHDVTFYVRGNSMRPLLRDSLDKVTVTPVTPGQIKKGAIMLFRHGTRHIMHRVKKITGDDVIFAGDGNYRTLEQAQKDDIIAVVKAVTRPDGKVIDCRSKLWRTQSALWLALPAIVRRYTLGIMRRLTKQWEQ